MVFGRLSLLLRNVNTSLSVYNTLIASVLLIIYIACYNFNMLPTKYRLKKKSAFHATYKTGKSFHKNGLTAFCGKVKSDEQKDFSTKIGFVVSKKVHKRAVKRNRMKRLMRESMRLYIKSYNNEFNSNYLSIIFTGSTKLLDKDFKFINKCLNEIMGMIQND